MNVADLLFLAGIVSVLICAGLSTLGALDKGQRVVDDFFSPFLSPDELAHPAHPGRALHPERHTRAGLFFWLAAILFLLSYLLR
jgi:hypothetical protein